MQSFDAATLANDYQAGTITPADVVEEALARIERRGADGVWIALAPRDRLLDDARALAQRRAAGERLPLYGLPFAVKDNIDVAGLPTTAACPAVRLPARGARAGGGAADRRRRAGRRQDQPRSVRDRPGRRPLALRHPPQPVRRALHRRRLQLRLGGRRSRRGWSASRSAPTPRARGAYRRRSTTSSASSRAAACSARRASCPPAARSTACRSSR